MSRGQKGFPCEEIMLLLLRTKDEGSTDATCSGMSDYTVSHLVGPYSPKFTSVIT